MSEKFTRDFFCEGVDEGKKSHLVRLDVVAKSLDLGEWS